MLLSKTSIMVMGVAESGGDEDVLTGVHIAGDGTTVASNGRMMMAVEPVAEESFFPIEDRAEVPREGVTVPVHLMEQVRKNLPREKRAVMQQAAVTKCGDGKIEMTTISKTEQRTAAARLMTQRYPRWKEVLAESKRRAGVTRICLNRKDLIGMLTVLEKACPDPSNKNAVFIEMGAEGDPMVLRTLNLATGQHVVGIVNPLDTGGMWISADPWEEEIYASGGLGDGGADLPAVPVGRRGRKKRRVNKRKVGK